MRLKASLENHGEMAKYVLQIPIINFKKYSKQLSKVLCVRLCVYIFHSSDYKKTENRKLKPFG